MMRLLFSSTDDVAVSVFGMLLVLARSYSFVIVKDVKIFKELPQAVFFNEVNKFTAIFPVSKCVRLDRLIALAIVVKFWIEIVSCRHHYDAARLHGAFHSRHHRFEPASPHATYN